MFCNYNKEICLELIKDNCKNKVMNLVENWKNNETMKIIKYNNKYNSYNKSKKSDINLCNEVQTKYYVKLKKFDINIQNYNKLIKTKQLLNNTSNNMLSEINALKETIEDLNYKLNTEAWSFLNSVISIINIEDELKYEDQYKLVDDAIKMIKDKDNKKLTKYFEKKDFERNKKIKELYSNCLELNDYRFLKCNNNFLNIKIYNNNNNNNNNNKNEKFKKEEDMLDCIFDKVFLKKLNNFIKSNIINYLDLNSILSFALTSKNYYNYIFDNNNNICYSFEYICKIYCSSLFKYSNIYSNDLNELSKIYKNFYDMIKCRPRIKYGGIYYCFIKIVKRVDPSITCSDSTSMFTTFNFRFMRFFPNGKVAFLSSPFKESKILYKKIVSQGSFCECKLGDFYVENNYLYIVMEYNKYCNLYYKFCIKNYSKNYYNYSLVLKECFIKDILSNNESEFKINEYFPKNFKYRPINILQNSLYISSKI